MRHPQTTLKNELLQNPERFEFFEAARVLQLLRASDADAPEVHFHTAAKKSFPAGEVDSIYQDDDMLHMYVNVIGLFGPTGVLPHADKDLVVGGAQNALLRDFLDVFNRRIIKAFYEAWKANRQDVSFEMFRRNPDSREDGCTTMLLALSGLGIASTRKQRDFSDDVFAAASGLLCRNVRSASSIRRCINSEFKLPVKINEFVEERLFLPREIQTRLGDQSTGAHQVLGSSAILGEAVTSHRQRFEVRLGPLSAADFHAMNPYGNNLAFRRLIDLIKGVLGRPLDFDIRFCVYPDAVTPTQLGSSRLGFDSWVTDGSSKQQRDDPVKRFDWDAVAN